MVGQDGVRVLGVPVGIARCGVDLDREEALAEHAAQRLEALLHAERVVAEAQPENALPRLGALLHPSQVLVRDADVGLA